MRSNDSGNKFDLNDTISTVSKLTSLTCASSATSTQPIIVQCLNSVITKFLFILLWVLSPYASS